MPLVILVTLRYYLNERSNFHGSVLFSDVGSFGSPSHNSGSLCCKAASIAG